MNAEKLRTLHKRKERVTVFWPGGPHNFVIEFDAAVPWPIAGERWRDWFLISGTVVEPVGMEYHSLRSFYVHPVSGGYALLPYGH